MRRVTVLSRCACRFGGSVAALRGTSAKTQPEFYYDPVQNKLVPFTTEVVAVITRRCSSVVLDVIAMCSRCCVREG